MPSVAIVGTRGYPSYYGGFETAVRKLAPFLIDHGWEVSVYGRPESTKPDDPQRDHRVRSIDSWGLDTTSLSTITYGATASLHTAWRKPDVALVMNVANGFWLPFLRSRRIPTVVNVDGIEWERAKWGPLARSTFRLGARATARFGTLMVYDSTEIARRWAAEFDVGGEFIPYGGDVPASLPVEPGLEHRGYVLYVARFVPENSFEEFLEVAEDLSRRSPVVIVGSSGFQNDLDAKVARLTEEAPGVRWLGHIADDQRLLSLWQHAGAYFHGHSVGGTNPALVQAMACGAPIVARDTVFNREVLGNEGAFTSPDPEAVRSSIGQMITNPVRQASASANAVERASAKYSWTSVCLRYEQVLRSVLPSSGIPSTTQRP